MRTRADETESALAVSEPAVAGTDVTLQTTVAELVPVSSRHATQTAVFHNFFVCLSHQFGSGSGDSQQTVWFLIATVARQAKIDNDRRGYSP